MVEIQLTDTKQSDIQDAKLLDTRWYGKQYFVTRVNKKVENNFFVLKTKRGDRKWKGCWL